jgi:hypothetical protein
VRLLENALRCVEQPGMLCLLCNYEFSAERRPLSRVLLTGLRSDLSKGIANGLSANLRPR